MAKITNVFAEIDNDSVFKTVLNIYLGNEQVIIFSLESKARDPAYIAIYEDKRLFEPKTDGESVYWKNGPRIMFTEIMRELEGG